MNTPVVGDWVSVSSVEENLTITDVLTPQLVAKLAPAALTLVKAVAKRHIVQPETRGQLAQVQRHCAPPDVGSRTGRLVDAARPVRCADPIWPRGRDVNAADVAADSVHAPAPVVEEE